MYWALFNSCFKEFRKSIWSTDTVFKVVHGQIHTILEIFVKPIYHENAILRNALSYEDIDRA